MMRRLPRSLSLLPSSRTHALRLIHDESTGWVLTLLPFGGAGSASAPAATDAAPRSAAPKTSACRRTFLTIYPSLESPLKVRKAV